MNNFAALARFGTTSAALAALLGILPSASAGPADKSFADMIGSMPLVRAGEPESDMQAKVTEALNFVQRMELFKASVAVNEALQLAPRNSYLHFLNGFVYQLQARQGDTQKNDMAIEGYQQALRIDPSNWIAQEFLGLAYLDQKQFDDAKAQFSDVLLMTPDSAVSIYGLMMASYLTGDAVTACAMADQYQKISAAPHSGYLRSSVSVYASCGDFDQADRMRAQLSALNGGTADVERVERRLAQWKSFYRQKTPVNQAAGSSAGRLVQTSVKNTPTDAPAMQLAQAFTPPSIKLPAAARPAPKPAASPAAATAATPTAAEAATPRPAAAASADSAARMVLVDVVLVSTQEQVSTSKGVNLLNALTLQLGSATNPAFSRLTSATSASGAASTISTAITRAVTVPALAYSLNIANANSAANEVLARPTLAAIEGLPSEFFSGTNLSAGVVSASTQGGTTIVPLDKRFGIKLAVTPAFLVDGKVQLKVEAQRTSLNASADTPKVAYQVEIAEITANANVVMSLGDTLVLSGLSEKSTSTTRDGVPGLQDVPLVQYLFSNKKVTDIQRSVLILITPRAPAYAEAAHSPAVSNSMNALREKFGLARAGSSNTDAVLSQLSSNALFREFRQGDVSMERWDHMQTTGERLRQALEFLYY